MRGSRAAVVLAALVYVSHAQAKPEIIIDPGGVTPQSLKVITEAVDAIARLAEDQDGGETTRLRRRARDATVAALATQGYFSPTVTLAPGTDVAGDTWDITIGPGPRATIRSVDLQFTGRVLRPEYAARIAQWREDWSLKVGQPFINDNWSKAKATLLDNVSARDFMLAAMTGSQADVYAEDAKVDLKVVIDSGPLVRLGALQTQGLERVPESLVTRYVRYDKGAPYNQEQLDDWQQELQSTAFFRGAFVTLRRSGAQPVQTEAPPPSGLPADVKTQPVPAVAPQVYDSDGELTLPVDVRVVEAPPKALTVAVGFDDTAGARFETLYRQNVVFGLPLTMETGVGADRLQQRAFMDFTLPPDARGRRNSIGVLAQHSDIQGLDVTRYALGFTQAQDRKAAGDSRVEYETRWGGLLAHDHVQIDGGPTYDLPTATLTADWLRRDVDSKYDPREGNLIAAGAGLGAVLDNGDPYLRLRLRGQKWWPVGQRDVLTLRGELGRVWSNSKTHVPDDFGFRTGGARSIRGYRYQSIGLKRNSATVGAPTLAVASVEYDHYFDERWGIGFFVDAGDAAESFGSMDLAVGYGVGARVRTPAGPLFLDVAYGQRERDLRLHFSLGIAF
ncbi:autotransporter assembly complex protein TamA [Bordetella avium]|uniref:Surface antigen n=1 Tax=Bordetella avium (strain 197N) TaxID=360910 RepID=Q2KYR5_BORA1|nr:BamA/TamA family outer membrane protein [Bordetella avium]RIQ16828.1 hypothetical protein D0850_13735 [Bordetella avium]RIQ35163.1 hypothetical protein D0849_03880 [Bordetella avium]RIQ49510.1 hypothetical protein D0843_13455 [Bordetella avium]RIQ74619.1 hypothetical protein D0838_05350 [Bordetella avium]CAJ48080.1 putative surface antigen [Bordetella avium 197N]